MYSLIKTNFDQTLRARIFPVTPKQNSNNPGLNPDFHKGCTGKAHACGTAKSRLLQQTANSNNVPVTTTAHSLNANSSVASGGKKQVQRKNSISSETISDSGSENSAPSWLDTTDCVANGKVAKSNSHNCIGGGKTPEVKKRVFQLKKHNCNENVSIISKNSGKLLATSYNVARKSPTPTNSQRYRRFYSEGDRTFETGDSNASTSSMNVTPQQNKLKQQKCQQQERTFERIQKYRSFRVGNNSLRKALKTSTTIPTNKPITPSDNHNIRPPWNSGSALKTNMMSVSPTFNTRRYRNSFRRHGVTDWPTIWERSFALRGAAAGHSGFYKNYNETIKRKVCTQIVLYCINYLNINFFKI